jgi:ABC-2 type transport system ATP-binding protein
MENVIQVERLTRKFGTFTAVDAISFEVRRGEIFGFLGANGAGKTTALKMLTGLLSPSAGMARVAGFDVASQPEEVKRHIGYMSQRFSLYEDLTVRENIRFFGGVYGLSRQQLLEKSEQVIRSLGLEGQSSQLVGSLPLGWRQKLAFAVAQIHEPKVVFLDEPTSGVDPVTRRQFWEGIYEASARGVTLMVTTHYMEEAEYCHRVSIMVDGVIQALDTPLGLKKRFQVNSMDEVFRSLTPRPPLLYERRS